MAGLAVGSSCSSVIESNFLPGIGIMAGSTISLEVIKRLYIRMTVYALIRRPSVLAIEMALLTL